MRDRCFSSAGGVLRTVLALAGRRRIFGLLSCDHGLLSLGKLASIRLAASVILLDSGTSFRRRSGKSRRPL